jgi:hypothetical protein
MHSNTHSYEDSKSTDYLQDELADMKTGGHAIFQTMVEEVNSTKIHCKNFCDCLSVPPVGQ